MLQLLGTEGCVFFSAVGVSLVYFRLLGHLINLKLNIKGLGFRVLFAVINGIIITFAESFSDGKSNLTIISLITMVLVFELYAMNRRKDYYYLYFHSYWLTSLQLQTAYLFSSALVNLFLYKLWETGSREHRLTIFSVTLIMAMIIFAIQMLFPKDFISMLGDILQKRSHTYLLGLYTMSATAVLAVSGSLISYMLYTDIPLEVKRIMYPDVIIKNLLILGGCLLIIVYLVLSETINNEKLELNEALATEKEFRTKFHSDSLLSYCANVTKNRFVKEKSEFILPDEMGYSESMMDFIMETVHPEDMEKLAVLTSLEYYEKRLDNDPHYSLKIRLAPKAILALASVRLSEETREQLRQDRDWIWVEFHITVIRESGTNDILTYISLNSIDKEMLEKEELESAVNTDPLTGLLNRKGFEGLLKEYLANDPNSGALFMIDMDYFKSVNDKLGHPVGDQVLKDTAEILRSVFRDRDLLCRLGGDEFCVFTKGLADRKLIQQRAELLNQQGKRTYRSPEGDLQVTVSFSIGVAIHHTGTFITYDQLYQQTDAILYQAKESGRDTYRLKDFV